MSLANSDDTKVLSWSGLVVGKTCTPDEEDFEEVPLLVLEKKSVISLHPVENNNLINWIKYFSAFLRLVCLSVCLSCSVMSCFTADAF